MSEELVPVKTFAFRAEAEIAQLLLSSAGIESVLEEGGEPDQSRLSHQRGIKVLVEPSLLDDANEALQG